MTHRKILTSLILQLYVFIKVGCKKFLKVSCIITNRESISIQHEYFTFKKYAFSCPPLIKFKLHITNLINNTSSLCSFITLVQLSNKFFKNVHWSQDREVLERVSRNLLIPVVN